LADWKPMDFRVPQVGCYRKFDSDFPLWL
jgi:hypothetical protein